MAAGKKTGGRVKGSKNKHQRKAVEMYLKVLNPTSSATGMTKEEVSAARKSIKEVIEDSFFDMQKDVRYNLQALAAYDLSAFYNFVGKIVPREVLGNIQHDQTINIVIEKNYEKPLQIETPKTDEISYEDINDEPMNDDEESRIEGSESDS